MKKTKKILACVGHIKYNSIKIVVGCSPQLVYQTLRSDKSKHAIDKKDKCKDDNLKFNEKYATKVIDLKLGDKIEIIESDDLWTVSFIGNFVVSIKSGHTLKNITKDKIIKIV